MTATARPRRRQALDGVVACSAVPAGFLGRKVALVCGECQRPSEPKGAQIGKATNHRDRIIAFCIHCETWNLTGLVLGSAAGGTQHG